MLKAVFKNINNKELFLSFATILSSTYVLFVILRLGWRLIKTIKSREKTLPITFKDCFKIKSWKHILLFVLLFSLSVATLYFSKKLPNKNSLSSEVAFPPGSVKIVLKTNPPIIAIIDWQFNRHEVGVEKVESKEVALSVNGTSYTLPASETQQIFMGRVEGNKLTIFEGFEAGVTYELISFNQQEIVISAQEWAAPPADKSFSSSYKPKVQYFERKYTDTQLMKKALETAKSDIDRAIVLCSELKQTYIPDPNSSSYPLPTSCFWDVAYEIVGLDYDKAVATCKKIEENGRSFCLEAIVSKFIWQYASLEKIMELNDINQLCQIIIDASQRNFCEKNLEARLEAENCFHLPEGSKQAECFWVVAQKVRKEAVDEENAGIACHKIVNSNLAIICEAGLERQEVEEREIVPILFRKWEKEESRLTDKEAAVKEIDKELIMTVILQDFGRSSKEIEIENFNIYGRDAYVDVYLTSPTVKNCIGTSYRLYTIKVWEIKDKIPVSRCD